MANSVQDTHFLCKEGNLFPAALWLHAGTLTLNKLTINNDAIYALGNYSIDEVGLGRKSFSCIRMYVEDSCCKGGGGVHMTWAVSYALRCTGHQA